MFEHEVYRRGEEEPEMWPATKGSKLGGMGKRPREIRLCEKELFAQSRVIREFATMRRCLPSFVSIQFPTGFLDWRRFAVVISLMGPEIVHNDQYYGGRSYRFELRVAEEYPIRPPLVECVTPVFHPNIGEEGSVGLRMLRAGKGMYSCDGWVATDTIEGVIFKLYRLFLHPCNEDTFVLNQDAAYFYTRKPTEFKSLVRRFVNAKQSRNNYYSDSESFCSSTSSSQSADYYQ